MKSKIFVNVMLGILMLLSVVNAVDFYDTYELSFTNGNPESLALDSLICEDSQCSEAIPSNAEFFLGDAISCWEQGVGQSEFESCVDKYSVSDVVDLSNCDTISNGCSGNPHLVVKYENIESSSFGFLNYFYSSEDSYLVNFDRITSFSCDSSNFCFNENPVSLSFSKKEDPAIAEVGQVNIKNIDDPLKPIQVDVPVVIEESVCSAFRFAQPDFYRPKPPIGYSDFSVDTLISLTIEDMQGSSLNTKQSILLPIEADTCAALGAFSWTPDSNLEDTKVNFTISSEVVDNQVTDPREDFHSVIETIYPENLDGACWTRAYDFTLSNVDSTDMSTSVAQIREGESLYALFNAGAFRDESITPMDFEAILQFDGDVVYNELLETSPVVNEDDLETHSVDLTNSIAGLSPGAYDVTLITRPLSSTCEITSDVTQTQNLDILEMETFNVTFHVFDNNSNPLEGATINMELLDADDYFVDEPGYNQTLITDANAEATFTGVYRGDYEYFASAPGFTNVINDIHVGGNMDITINLATKNAAPRIDLPENLTTYYKDSVELDIRDYVMDFNNAFADLSFDYKVVSGDVDVSFDDETFTFSTDRVNTAVVEINVSDLDGAKDSDRITINFIDNKAPLINQFEANSNEGNVPFAPQFFIDVSDEDGDTLECILESGTGDSVLISDCANDESISSLGYSEPGTYTATLTVDDGINEPVVAQTQIFVYNRTVDTPLIERFNLLVDGELSTKSQVIIPADLELEWSVSHSNNWPMQCSLRINETTIPVNCVGDYDLGAFNQTGFHRFSLIAEDNDSTQVVRTIKREFLRAEDVKLNAVSTDLIVDQRIVPGEFEFAIETTNETLSRREIFVRPIIECRDINNTLDIDGGLLDTSAISKEDDSRTTFNFVTDTHDFKLKVPVDENCEFKAILTDGFGSRLELSEEVVFSYPQEEANIASVRGKGTDVLDYISSTMVAPMDSGYNSIEFNVVNNEDDAKELSITMTSAQLDVEFSEELNLGSDQSREVQIPLYISKDTKPGLYPVRFGVRDGGDKQVRYSYVVVE